MENHPIPEITYIMLFSLVLASSAAFPDAAFNAAQSLRRRWKHLMARIRSAMVAKQKRSGKSFWEIDMTRFEP